MKAKPNLVVGENVKGDLTVGGINNEFTNDKLVSFYISRLVVNIFSVSEVNGSIS